MGLSTMLQDILIPLIVVGLAELGDKTQLSTLLLASKTEKHPHLLFGVILAFLLVDGIAILAGDWISSIAQNTFGRYFHNFRTLNVEKQKRRNQE